MIVQGGSTRSSGTLFLHCPQGVKTQRRYPNTIHHVEAHLTWEGTGILRIAGQNNHTRKQLVQSTTYLIFYNFSPPVCLGSVSYSNWLSSKNQRTATLIVQEGQRGPAGSLFLHCPHWANIWRGQNSDKIPSTHSLRWSSPNVRGHWNTQFCWSKESCWDRNKTNPSDIWHSKISLPQAVLGECLIWLSSKRQRTPTVVVRRGQCGPSGPLSLKCPCWPNTQTWTQKRWEKILLYSSCFYFIDTY